MADAVAQDDQQRCELCNAPFAQTRVHITDGKLVAPAPEGHLSNWTTIATNDRRLSINVCGPLCAWRVTGALDRVEKLPTWASRPPNEISTIRETVLELLRVPALEARPENVCATCGRPAVTVLEGMPGILACERCSAMCIDTPAPIETEHGPAPWARIADWCDLSPKRKWALVEGRKLFRLARNMLTGILDPRVSEEQLSGAFDNLETFFTKTVGYTPASVREMTTIRYVVACAKAPVERRKSVERQAIQFLNNDYPDNPIDAAKFRACVAAWRPRNFGWDEIKDLVGWPGEAASLQTKWKTFDLTKDAKAMRAMKRKFSEAKPKKRIRRT